MARYKLLQKAAHDLGGIYEHGILTFGLEHADLYFDGLTARLQMIADNPAQYPSVDYVRSGYRRSVFGVHSIYYRTDREGVVVVRILGRQNPSNAFD